MPAQPPPPKAKTVTQRRLYSRAEFEAMRRSEAHAMASDPRLRADALDVLARADRHYWIHQTNWFGEPVLNLPQDLFALQEIVFRTRPRHIVEIGVAWGGGLLFHSTLMEALGGESVIGVDLYLPDDLRERLASFGKISDRLQLVHGSSTAPATIERVRKLIGSARDVLVILDSDHSHDHVLAELRAYSTLVGRGHYLVCSDTMLERLPEQTHRPRPWGPGNNPATALDAFLRENDRFDVDGEIEEKLLFTCNPRGYLRCVKD